MVCRVGEAGGESLSEDGCFDHAFLYYPCSDEPSKSDSAIRFAVRSLGWVRINEEDLTPERSSKAVNKCIVDLSHGKNDLLDVVGRWGDVSLFVRVLDWLTSSQIRTDQLTNGPTIIRKTNQPTFVQPSNLLTSHQPIFHILPTKVLTTN